MKALILSLALISGGAFVHAEETTGEKVNAKAHDAKRAMKKGVHHVQEATCMEGDAKCAAKKAGHKIKEGGDAAKDGVNKAVDKID